MFWKHRVFLFAVAAGMASLSVRGEEKPARVLACAGSMDNYFEDELWAKVAVRTCLTCHRKGGDAEESKFLLIDPRKIEGKARDEAMRHNRAAFTKMAAAKEKDKSRLLLKVVGELDHGG